jgi:hypothetical protein
MEDIEDKTQYFGGVNPHPELKDSFLITLCALHSRARLIGGTSLAEVRLHSGTGSYLDSLLCRSRR